MIIDDNAAKKTAKYLGLSVTGTMGVLLRAKREGYLTEIAPIVEELRGNGFYISDNLAEMIFRTGWRIAILFCQKQSVG